MPVSNAWLLSFSDQYKAAIGNMEMVHILPVVPELTEISQLPNYCKYSIDWEGQVLPVMNIVSFLAGETEQQANETCYNNKLIGIVAYNHLENNKQSYGAFLLDKVPVRIEVDDKQASDLPESPAAWEKIAISCFEHNKGEYVPILDIPGIFSGIQIPEK